MPSRAPSAPKSAWFRMRAATMLADRPLRCRPAWRHQPGRVPWQAADSGEVLRGSGSLTWLTLWLRYGMNTALRPRGQTCWTSGSVAKAAANRSSDDLFVGHGTGEVGVVGSEIEVPMATQRGQDHRLLPGLLGLQASRIASAMAWVGSGAGTMPSVRANCTAAAKHSVCGTDSASIIPSSYRWEIIGAIPW